MFKGKNGKKREVFETLIVHNISDPSKYNTIGFMLQCNCYEILFLKIGLGFLAICSISRHIVNGSWQHCLWGAPVEQVAVTAGSPAPGVKAPGHSA